MPAADGTIAEIISDLARPEPTYNQNGLLEPGGAGFDYYPITPMSMASPLFRGSGLVRSADPTAYLRARQLGARLVWIADNRPFPHAKFANQAAADAYFGPRWDELAAQPNFDPQYVIVDVTNEPDSMVSVGGQFWNGTMGDFFTHWINCYTCIQAAGRANGKARFSGPNTATYRGTYLLTTANPPLYQDPAANADDWIFGLANNANFGNSLKAKIPVLGSHFLANAEQPDIVRMIEGERQRYMQHWYNVFGPYFQLEAEEFQAHEVVPEGFTNAPYPAWPHTPWHRSPGQSLLTNARLERAGATGACIACWNKPSDESGVGADASDCTMANLFGLLHPTSFLPRPRWWGYALYANGHDTRVWSSWGRIPSDNPVNYQHGGVVSLMSLRGGNADATSYAPGPYPLDLTAIGQAVNSTASGSAVEWGKGIVRRTIRHVRQNPRLSFATSITVLKRRLRHIPGGAAGGQVVLTSETVPIVNGSISYTLGSAADYAQLHDAYACVLTPAA